MTGFGSARGEVDGTNWAWELRAVNGKGHDVRLRLPQGCEWLEQSCRKQISAQVARGNIQAGLTIRPKNPGMVTSINSDALTNLLAAIEEIESSRVTSPSSAAEILALRGVLDSTEPEIEDTEKNAIGQALAVGLDEALEALNQHRASEGSALSSVLLSQLDRINELTVLAEADPSRTTNAISIRLAEQIRRLCADGNEIDPERLYQEVALLATKADIREELDRLFAHVDAARNLLNQGSPVGRKLEFLAQEFNRESNTLCSKSNAVTLTKIGLELKVMIDQFREQILNVE